MSSEKYNVTILKGMLRRNIEHFLKKLMYEKLGISEMKFANLYF